MMAPLAGYAMGLIFIVPLSDFVENRRLILCMLAAAMVSAGVASVSVNFIQLFGALFILGSSCSCIQVLVPMAASMAPPEQRGRAVGDIMAGLMLGVVAARPFASFAADMFGWRFVYALGSFAIGLICLLLVLRLPISHPFVTSSSYFTLIKSMWQLVRGEDTLRRRATTAGLVMASFSMFWSTVALHLEACPTAFSQKEIAVFALVGAGGVLATPVAGRLGDRGFTRVGTISAHVMIFISMLIAALAGYLYTFSASVSVISLGLSAIALDVGLTTDHTLGRREINLIRPEARGRMNGLFVGLFFIGGSVGAALSGVTWSLGGWWLTCVSSSAFAALALLVDFAWHSQKSGLLAESHSEPV